MKDNYKTIFLDDKNIQLKEIYLEHRPAFLGFGKKYNLSESELVDVYQDAFIALRKHAISGKLETINCSIRTYLFGIGKHLIFNELKRKKKFVLNTSHFSTEESEVEEISIELEPDLTIEQKLLQQNFKKLGKKCQQMLTMFYYNGLTIEEIAEKANYGNQNVVKSQKSRCLKTLKEYIKNR